MARQKGNHDIIKKIFGVDKIHSFCPPGLSLSYVGYYVATEMVESAKTLSPDGWLPLSIKVGDKVLGPADWIRAALAVLSGEDTVTV